MARSIYGADGSAQVVSPTGTPMTAPATVKSARTGGITVTDIQNMSGANLGGIVTPDSRGQIIFQGPDNSTATYWLDFGDGGPRWAINPVDLPGLMTNAAAARELAQYTTPSGTRLKSGVPYVTNTISQKIAEALDGKVVPRFASASARDTAFPAPTDGDRCYRTDLHAHQTYRAMSTARWVTDPALIDEVVLAADAASVVFNNIPQEWRHLVLKFKGRASGSQTSDVKAQRLSLRCNNDSTTNYQSFGFIRGMKVVAGANTFEVDRAGAGGSTTITTAASYGSGAGGLSNFTAAGVTTMHIGILAGSDFSVLHGGGEVVIEDYTNTNTRKTFQGHSGVMDAAGNAGTGYQYLAYLQGGWSNSAAITRLDLLPTSATAFVAGSRFSLYGLS
jgi:hypothetical protein